jgi:hypothetical protein
MDFCTLVPKQAGRWRPLSHHQQCHSDGLRRRPLCAAADALVLRTDLGERRNKKPHIWT